MRARNAAVRESEGQLGERATEEARKKVVLVERKEREEESERDEGKKEEKQFSGLVLAFGERMHRCR